MSAAPDLLDDFDIISPESFARHGYPHEEWKRLRAESPVHFYEDTPIPFWAITKHADITTISRQSSRGRVVAPPRDVACPRAWPRCGVRSAISLMEASRPLVGELASEPAQQPAAPAPKKPEAETVGRPG